MIFELTSAVFCQCGCGKLFAKYDKYGRPRKFIHGHNKSMLGVYPSEETRRKIGLASVGRTKGPKHWNWKGGRIMGSQGYWMIWKPEHPQAESNGHIPEHRLIYEEYYGCCILPYIECHHINEIPTDNRIENLKLMTKADHARLHQIGKSRSLITRQKIGEAKKLYLRTHNVIRGDNGRIIAILH